MKAFIMRDTLFHIFAFLLLCTVNSLPSYADGEADAAMIAAIEAGDVQAFNRAIAGGANPNAIASTGKPALVWATETNQLNLVQLLVGEGASIDLANTNGDPAINVAARLGHTAIAKILLQHRANSKLGPEGGARKIAMRKGHKEILLLLSRHDGIAVPNPDAAMLADAINAGDLEGVLEALHLGVSANSLEFTGRPVLTLAAQQENPAIISALIAKGASLNTVDEIGYTALLEAALRGNVPNVKELLAAGADPTIKGEDGLSATIVMLQSKSEELQALARR